MRPVQYFSPEYLKQCRLMTPGQIARFLEDFRVLHGAPSGPSRLISLKVPEGLLEAFKIRARLLGIPYQSQIKSLMREWIKDA